MRTSLSGFGLFSVDAIMGLSVVCFECENNWSVNVAVMVVGNGDGVILVWMASTDFILLHVLLCPLSYVRALVCNFCKLQKNLWCYVPLEWKSLGSCEIRENLGPATVLQVTEKKKW